MSVAFTAVHVEVSERWMGVAVQGSGRMRGAPTSQDGPELENLAPQGSYKHCKQVLAQFIYQSTLAPGGILRLSSADTHGHYKQSDPWVRVATAGPSSSQAGAPGSSVLSSLLAYRPLPCGPHKPWAAMR